MALNIPNLLTWARILLIPVVVGVFYLPLTAGEQNFVATAAFLVAAVTDWVDGWLARKLNQTSAFGAFLDPVADKALLMSIYVALGVSKAIPATLAILVVSRDVMIVGGVIIAWLFDKPLEIRPLYVSKVNTTMQIAFAAAVLGASAFGFSSEYWFWPMTYIVAALTLASAGAYLGPWIRHMGH